ncbi:hypothetical protein [Streptomyces sp. NPDC049887]
MPFTDHLAELVRGLDAGWRQLGALGLLLNAIVPWTTKYIDTSPSPS